MQRRTSISEACLPVPLCAVFHDESGWLSRRRRVPYPIGICCQAVLNFSPQPLLYREERELSRTVLRCFSAATRLSKTAGCPDQRRTWAHMGAVPWALVEEILILADLEIPETVMRRLPLQTSLLQS